MIFSLGKMQFNPTTWTRTSKHPERYSRLKLPIFSGDTTKLDLEKKPLKNRGGLDDLIKYVGSNTGREIYQARHLSNKPLFEEWQSGLNEKHHAKKWTYDRLWLDKHCSILFRLDNQML